MTILCAGGAHADLSVSMAAAHARDPAMFDAVRAIVSRADELDHHKRGRFYPMTPLLRGTTHGHAGAAMALLEPIASPDRFPMPRSETARIALRAGLIEAAGDAKDPNAAPVLRNVITTATEFFEVRAAVEALGKLAESADVVMLAHLATAAGPRQEAAVAGLGSCRRVVAAQALEKVSATHPTGMFAKHLLRSLGTMGSSWALATPNAAPALEAPVIRDTAARAAFALLASSTEADVRADAESALVVIAAPDTPRWISDAKKSASPDLAAALDDLTARIARRSP